MFATPAKKTHYPDQTYPAIDKIEEDKNNLTFKINRNSLIAIGMLAIFVYFEISSMINFALDGGLDFKISVMLFKMMLILVVFTITTFVVLVYIYRKTFESFLATNKSVVVIKQTMDSKIERLKFYDETAIKEKIKSIVTCDADRTKKK